MMTHPFFISFLLFLARCSSTFCNPLGGTQGSSLTCPTPSHTIPKLGVDRMTHFEGTWLESQRFCRSDAWRAQFTSLLHCPRSKCIKPKIRQSHSSNHVTVSFSLYRKVAKYLPHLMTKTQAKFSLENLIVFYRVTESKILVLDRCACNVLLFDILMSYFFPFSNITSNTKALVLSTVTAYNQPFVFSQHHNTVH